MLAPLPLIVFSPSNTTLGFVVFTNLTGWSPISIHSSFLSSLWLTGNTERSVLASYQITSLELPLPSTSLATFTLIFKYQGFVSYTILGSLLSEISVISYIYTWFITLSYVLCSFWSFQYHVASLEIIPFAATLPLSSTQISLALNLILPNDADWILLPLPLIVITVLSGNGEFSYEFLASIFEESSLSLGKCLLISNLKPLAGHVPPISSLVIIISSSADASVGLGRWPLVKCHSPAPFMKLSHTNQPPDVLPSVTVACGMINIPATPSRVTLDFPGTTKIMSSITGLSYVEWLAIVLLSS